MSKLQNPDTLGRHIQYYLNHNYEEALRSLHGQIMTFVEALGGSEAQIKARKDLALQFITPFKLVFNHKANEYLGQQVDGYLDSIDANRDLDGQNPLFENYKEAPVAIS